VNRAKMHEDKMMLFDFLEVVRKLSLMSLMSVGNDVWPKDTLWVMVLEEDEYGYVRSVTHRNIHLRRKSGR
jgi:hypothetical protein